MANQVTNYQCPACTGPLNFDPETGKVSCEYCGSIYELSQIEALYREKDASAAEAAAEAEKKQEDSPWDESDLTNDWGADGEGMKTYSCPSCTAELICDETTAATACPYCGNPTIVPGQFTGSLKPDFVIPFKLKKEDAVAALKKHYGKRFFLPKSFKSDNHIEKVQGVYVPFWLFDGEAEGTVVYNTTRSRRYRQGDYEITETSHFVVTREGSVAFEKIPVDASSKMPDDHMDSIEPYDYSELKPFSSAYLPGFLADKYDVSIEQSKARADERCDGTLEEKLRDTVVGYETVVPMSKNFRLHRGKVHYALLPVWLLNTRWNGENFLFAMNGQSGKMVGDLPVDKKKYWLTFLGIGMVLSVLGLLLVL
ncbi:MAG: hypothetical protein J6J43_02115 [Oscillospiraceae bacterium]|nr:hypothetical protein [Oscillospiraceae bacterium]